MRTAITKVAVNYYSVACNNYIYQAIILFTYVTFKYLIK